MNVQIIVGVIVMVVMVFLHHIDETDKLIEIQLNKLTGTSDEIEGIK